ncbi:hypothetical protein ACOI22_14380 [Glaciecola sp. 2405UD65-10]|uniref:hypothetical protein n=1 Tax=Glaciecola sp. 2405UD65-10 TaxID=3397244 RepID=UPI003B58C615
MKHPIPYARLLVFALFFSMLVACGGAVDDQDQAQDTDNALVDSRITISALTLNGYVANALVWIDARNNNTIDGFESYAYTDAQGFVSYNPNTGVNYCATSEESLQRFCLQTATQSGEIIIKAAKGLELLSGESFKSVLTAKIDVQTAKTQFNDMLALGAKPLGNTSTWQESLDPLLLKLSPLSSLSYYLQRNATNNSTQSETAITSILINMGYSIPSDTSDDDILAKEYIAGISLDDPLADDLFAASLMMSRLVDTVSVNLDSATESYNFGESGLPISTADSVYQALATSLVNGVPANTASNNKTSAYKNLLINETQLSADLIENSLGNLDALFVENNLSNANVTSLLTRVEQNTNLTILLTKLVSIGEQHFAQIDTSENLLNQMLTLNQSLTLPTLSPPIVFMSNQEATGQTTLATYLQSPDNRISELLSNENAATVAAFEQSNSLTANFDLNTLAHDLRNIASQDGGEEALGSEDVAIPIINLASVNTADASSFYSGKRLSLSGILDEVEQGQVLIYFAGSENAKAGEIHMCIAYKNERDPGDNISAQLFDGTWSLIGTASQNRISLVSEGFTIQMKVLGESYGEDIPANQTVPSLPRNANELYGRFGFTLNDDTSTWHSDNASVNQSYGFMDYTELPASNSDCATNLNLTVN